MKGSNTVIIFFYISDSPEAVEQGMGFGLLLWMVAQDGV